MKLIKDFGVDTKSKGDAGAFFNIEEKYYKELMKRPSSRSAVEKAGQMPAKKGEKARIKKLIKTKEFNKFKQDGMPFYLGKKNTNKSKELPNADDSLFKPSSGVEGDDSIPFYKGGVVNIVDAGKYFKHKPKK